MREFLKLRLIVPAAVFGVAAALVAVAAAQTNPANGPSGTHYKSGSPTASCLVGTDGSVSCNSYTLGGVGNINATVDLKATYAATVVCINNGGNASDSQHQGSFSAETGPIPLTSTKNGFLTVPPLSVNAPSESAFLAQQTCPNPGWTPTVPGGITLTSFTYTLTFAGFSGPYITFIGP